MKKHVILVYWGYNIVDIKKSVGNASLTKELSNFRASTYRYKYIPILWWNTKDFLGPEKFERS
jgi:hypothetical protein